MPDLTIQYIKDHPNDQALDIGFEGYMTPVNLLEKGIIACNNCGTLNPIGIKYCSGCRDFLFGIRRKDFKD